VTSSYLVRNYNKYWLFIVFKNICGTPKLWLKLLLPLYNTVIHLDLIFFPPSFGGHSFFYTEQSRPLTLRSISVVTDVYYNGPVNKVIVRFDRIAAENMKITEIITVFWAVTPCILAQICRRSSETSACLHRTTQRHVPFIQLKSEYTLCRAGLRISNRFRVRYHVTCVHAALSGAVSDLLRAG
jgi:hypothetical protein